MLDCRNGGSRIDGLHLLLEIATDRVAGPSHVPDGMGKLKAEREKKESYSLRASPVSLQDTFNLPLPSHSRPQPAPASESQGKW